MDRFEATSMMPAVADAPVDFIAADLRGIVGGADPGRAV